MRKLFDNVKVQPRVTNQHKRVHLIKILWTIQLEKLQNNDMTFYALLKLISKLFVSGVPLTASKNERENLLFH